jgi:hypothetical protein
VAEFAVLRDGKPLKIQATVAERRRRNPAGQSESSPRLQHQGGWQADRGVRRGRILV